MSGESSFSVNRLGFRGRELEIEKPPKEFRVFMLGGSATECALIDDAAAPNIVLEKYLIEHLPQDRTYNVQNAAHSGDKSFDHIAVLSHRIAHLSPDAVTIMAGVNELYADVQRVDWLHVSGQSPADYDTELLIKLFLTKFEIGKRTWSAFHPNMAHVRQNVFAGSAFETNFKWAVERCNGLPESKEPLPTNLDFYERNLISLIGISRAHGATVVLATQPSTWGSDDDSIRAWHWVRCIGDTRYNESDLERAMDAHNEVVRRVSERLGLRLVDLARSMPKTAEFFTDDVHFNQHGSDRMAEALGQGIVDSLNPAQ